MRMMKTRSNIIVALTLIVLVGWGVVALGYSVAERAVASRVPAAVPDAGDGGRTVRSGAR